MLDLWFKKLESLCFDFTEKNQVNCEDREVLPANFFLSDLILSGPFFIFYFYVLSGFL